MERRRDGGRFQSTCPLRGTTPAGQGRDTLRNNFNPRAPCGARHLHPCLLCKDGNFNPRAPCGARHVDFGAHVVRIHFNPRAPCGARPHSSMDCVKAFHFNPRAPCGARQDRQPDRRRTPGFQSTCPLRGTTVGSFPLRPKRYISIHVPLAGHDISSPIFSILARHFNPRAPCGARRDYHSPVWGGKEFQSTCPLRGTTISVRIWCTFYCKFQSTCPLRGTTLVQNHSAS